MDQQKKFEVQDKSINHELSHIFNQKQVDDSKFSFAEDKSVLVLEEEPMIEEKSILTQEFKASLINQIQKPVAVPQHFKESLINQISSGPTSHNLFKKGQALKEENQENFRVTDSPRQSFVYPTQNLATVFKNEQAPRNSIQFFQQLAKGRKSKRDSENAAENFRITENTNNDNKINPGLFSDDTSFETQNLNQNEYPQQ